MRKRLQKNSNINLSRNIDTADIMKSSLTKREPSCTGVYSVKRANSRKRLKNNYYYKPKPNNLFHTYFFKVISVLITGLINFLSMDNQYSIYRPEPRFLYSKIHLIYGNNALIKQFRQKKITVLHITKKVTYFPVPNYNIDYRFNSKDGLGSIIKSNSFMLTVEALNSYLTESSYDYRYAYFGLLAVLQQYTKLFFIDGRQEAIEELELSGIIKHVRENNYISNMSLNDFFNYIYFYNPENDPYIEIKRQKYIQEYREAYD